MAYRYHSRRSAKRLAKKSRRNFIITLILISFLLYATITWILPFFITGLGFITDFLKPNQKIVTKTENTSLAPPVLAVPFEATNTAQIDIKGYATSHSKVKLFLDDEARETVAVSAQGEFIIPNVLLSLGTNNIYAKTLDEKDSESLPSKTIKIIYDDEKSSLTLTEPEDNKIIQGGDKKIKFSGKTEPGVQVFINESQIIVDSEGNFTRELPLNDGDNNFDIKAVDQAANTTEISRKVPLPCSKS